MTKCVTMKSLSCIDKELDRLYQLRDEPGYILAWFSFYESANVQIKLKMLRELNIKRRLYSKSIALLL